MDFDFYRIFVTLFAVVVSITVHEFAHAASAVLAGDDTPRRQGRISLNPVDHFDPVGFIMIVFMTVTGFGIGWGKPVMVNPANFRNPRRDDVLVSLWGPVSNIIMATVCAILLRTGVLAFTPGLRYFLIIMVIVNIGLALFNLIPLPPLDGSHILQGILPPESARSYAQFASQYGMAILLLLLVTGGVRLIIGPPRDLLMTLLLGR
ncbi:MAG: peptidase M50 [Armatimonadota bacterium]|nr:MAG: peptidase M50 [Armatimonadota bacterium]